MSSAVIPPASAHPHSLHPLKGATALGPAPAHEHRYLVGNALHAVKVFVTAAFSVAILGEYADDDRGAPIPTARSASDRSASDRPADTHRPTATDG